MMDELGWYEFQAKDFKWPKTLVIEAIRPESESDRDARFALDIVDPQLLSRIKTVYSEVMGKSNLKNSVLKSFIFWKSYNLCQIKCLPAAGGDTRYRSSHNICGSTTYLVARRHPMVSGKFSCCLSRSLYNLNPSSHDFFVVRDHSGGTIQPYDLHESIRAVSSISGDSGVRKVPLPHIVQDPLL